VDTDDQRRLVEDARSGDPLAWERLYRNVFPRLRAYAAHRVAGDSVEDVVNETMTRAVAGIERFRWEPSGFDAWLFGIARRVVAGDQRRSGRTRRSSAVALQAPQSAEVGDAMETEHEHATVRRLFARLSCAEQEVLELRVIAGLTAEQTARALNKRPGAVRTAQSRALAHLRQLMEVEQ